MTSPIGAIGAVSGVSGLTPVSGLSGTEQVKGPNTDFASMLSQGLESVQTAQSKAGDLAVQVANGTLQDPAQYTMASTEAALGLQLTMAIRNKAVEAFQEIMRMQA
ncbi:flagellar hook-basal body complex protein FliE [Actinoplanes sp. NBRC 14428]|uniref:Flagellar hook-basal body complex protein FliE n=1 Tax=Pseudosporangium ferrugineum TaxID=439699 RepID=A0A2T0S5K3_9ACTN|nr:flagellar hook-basal body complex protein FliE [Pseudosporangium ferrugineum]PRY28717.1 flagellar hook-basal body complex protein FliE [Pseudosporangium ferrugineum]BCJ53822.1 flagellar hook-basal body complex protein FliE [Actinoplanes sp. NBRC 14428]